MAKGPGQESLAILSLGQGPVHSIRPPVAWHNLLAATW